MKKNLLNLKNAVVLLGILLFTTAANAFTAVTSGNWSSAATWGGVAPGNNVSGQSIDIPSGITVTLDMDVTFSGLLNSFSVDGTLSNTTSYGLIISQGTLSGAGQISINNLTFGTLSSMSFSGTLNLERLINNSPVLGLGAIANISDTLDLQNGNISLNNNSNLTMMSNSFIKIDNGSFSINGGIFNSSNPYSVMYVGNSKTSGIELNTSTLKHVYVNMANSNQTVTMGNNMIINGDLYLNTGKLSLNGRHLHLKGNLGVVSGASFTSNSTSEMTIEGSGALSSALLFDSGSSIDNLTINRTGQVNLQDELSIAGNLNLNDGSLSLQSGAVLTMNNGSTVHVEKGTLAVNTATFDGTAAYNVEYMGSTNYTSGMELSGSGLNNVTVNYSSATNQVTLNSNTTIDGNLDLAKGKLVLNGKMLTLNGTLSHNSNGKFKGDSNAELHLNLTSITGDTLYFDNANAASYSLKKLMINNSGTNAIVLGSDLNIENELNLAAGKLELSNGNLTIAAAASITGYDDTKYIVTSKDASGQLVMNVVAGSSYVTFPVGTSVNYSPAYIQQTSSGTSGNFNVKAMNGVYTNGTSGGLNSNTLKVVNRTWLISSSVPQVNMNLKLGWVSAAEVNGFNRANSYITHYTSSAWDVHTASTAASGSNNTYESTRTGITSLSPFAVTEVGQGVGIKETAANNFELFPNPAKDKLTIKLMNATADNTYEITDITGKVVAGKTSNSIQNTFDISHLNSGCYFIKVTNVADNTTSVTKFIKE